MSSAILSGGTTGTGINNLLAPSSNNNNTQTLPDRTGNLSMDGPAFSASLSGTQSVTTNTFTKVAFDTKNWDTNTNFNTSTYRFTPTVAGYYLVTGSIDAGGTASNLNRAIAVIYKNGSAYRLGENIGGNGSYITPYTGMVSAQVYLNGSTDYIELYGYVAGTTTNISVSTATWFDAVMVRSA